jgi:hypothetical protein
MHKQNSRNCKFLLQTTGEAYRTIGTGYNSLCIFLYENGRKLCPISYPFPKKNIPESHNPVLVVEQNRLDFPEIAFKILFLKKKYFPLIDFFSHLHEKIVLSNIF